jgi:hypothetical protein
MNSTTAFKEVIQKKINDKAGQDPVFKARTELKTKNIDDCVRYILNTVKESGVNGFTDDEVFGMAFHYYDEDNINVGGEIKAKVVSNHVDSSPQYKAWKITQAELKHLRKSIKEEPNKDLLKLFKDDLKQLEKEPLEYWKSLPVDDYEKDPDLKERYEEVKFMLEHLKPKKKPKASSEKTKPKGSKPRTTKKKSNTRKPKMQPVKADASGQTSLF